MLQQYVTIFGMHFNKTVSGTTCKLYVHALDQAHALVHMICKNLRETEHIYVHT